jgi:heterodisulfide reductase subunit B
MNFGYYPGCSLHGTAKEFDQSLNEVLKVLDVGLNEINDWCCCGASSAHAMSHILSIALPARNLQLAKNQGMTEVVAPCAACYNRLKVSQHELKFDEKMRMKIEEILEEKISNGIAVLNLIGLFQRIGTEKIKTAIKNNLKKFKVACYYGCLLVRPHDILKFDDPENPTSMEEIVSITGAKTVEWNFKVECCGASHSIDHTEIVEQLSKNILDDAIKHDASVLLLPDVSFKFRYETKKYFEEISSAKRNSNSVFNSAFRFSDGIKLQAIRTSIALYKSNSND